MFPKTLILHERHQYAIGHGFFHTASVQLVEPRHTFEYIYDVGAKKTKALLTPRLDEYADSLGRHHVDMLVLSHFHQDHVSGLDRLLLRCKVDTVVIPYLDPVEKILLIAARIAAGNADASSVGFSFEPSTWLKARGVRRILVIQPDLPQEDPERLAPESPNNLPREALAHWRLTKGPPTAQEAGPGEPLHGDTISHHVPLVLGLGCDGIWNFKFFCYQATEQWKKMAPMVADVFKASAADLNTTITPDWVLTKLQGQSTREKLKSVYRTLVGAGRINWTSLCLWSAPAQGLRYFGSSHAYMHGDGQRSKQYISEAHRVAWLGAGDAELADEIVANDFGKHFAAEAKEYPLASMSLPHHGSKENHNMSLLRELDPMLAYVTCPSAKDGPSKQKHPSIAVEQQIKMLRGQALLRVDENYNNAFHEWVRIYT